MQHRIQAGEAGKPLSRNIRLDIAFDGTPYDGWQVQKDRPTIQGILREAIREVTGERVNLHGSGRTDAGVHARRMVASFHTRSRVPAPAFARALNRLLPPEIRVLASRKAGADFHARLSARSKTYRYRVYRGPIMPPHIVRECFHYPYRVDVPLMRKACLALTGEHDFGSFAKNSGLIRKDPSNPSADRSTVRRILRVDLKQKGHELTFTVEGTGFLHHMVRNIVGTLLELGRGQMSPADFARLLQVRDRTLAGFTAPACGLTLLRVRY
jgi:tRNA pseudouridine38-40 synthase